MIRNRKGAGLPIRKTIATVIVILAVGMVIYAAVQFGLIDIVKNVFPQFKQEFGGGGDDEFVFEGICTFKVAKILDDEYIHFCRGDECESTEKSLLFISGSDLWVDQNVNDKIGGITTRGGRVSISSVVIGGAGGVYEEVENDLPSYEDLLNLNGAFVSETEVCRDTKVTAVGFRRALDTREVEVKGQTYFYDVYELIRNLEINKAITPLYLDRALKQGSEASWITADGRSISRGPEEGESFAREVIEVEKPLIKEGPQDIGNYAREVSEIGVGDAKEYK